MKKNALSFKVCGGPRVANYTDWARRQDRNRSKPQLRRIRSRRSGQIFDLTGGKMQTNCLERGGMIDFQKIKKHILELISRLDKEEECAPVGLRSLGLRVEYLNGVYKNKFSKTRFYGTMISPVSERPLHLRRSV